MSDVLSFRPSPEERRFIERLRRRLRLKTRTEAIRHLVRQAAAEEADQDDEPSVFRLRAPKEFRLQGSVTAEEIDAEVYDDLGGRTHP